MDTYVEVDFEKVLLDADDKEAVLFSIGGANVWIPRVVMLGGGYEERRDGTGSLEVPERIAIEKGLV